MEAQIPRQHVHSGDEQLPTSAMQGVDVGRHDHEPHEKISVIKKVKAKAKKIKEKVTKHGHGHEHDDHDTLSREENDDDDDDDDDEDEELVESPEVHGAPIYDESPAVRSGVGAGHPVGVNLEKPNIMAEDRYKNTITDPPTRPFSQAEPEQGQFRNIEHGVDENKGNPRVKIGTSTKMEEDPNTPKDGKNPDNYQTKVADPTGAGGAEVGITPILRSFDKMSVHDKPHTDPSPDNTPKKFTGSHDQFLPEPIPDNTAKMFTDSHDKLSPEPIPEDAPINPKDPASPLKALTDEKKQSSYTEKISFATSALTNKAVTAKNIFASKLGYGEKEGSGTSTAGEKEGSGISTTGGGVTATSVLTEKAAAAKNTVASKLGYGEKEGSGISTAGEKDGSGISTAGGGVTATSALTDKAVAAKNMVASKLGYSEKKGSGISTAGEKEQSGTATAGGGGQSGGGVTATVADYANRAAATVTGTLAPVTGKVTDVGSSLLSKVQGGPTGQNKMPTKGTEEKTIENKGPSKGVTGYLAEKLMPSKEDKALSGVISSTLYGKKAEGEDKPMGKVIVSDEVASRLGTTEEVPKREKENEGVDARVVGNVRPDMVGRVKGWLGMGQSQSSQPSQGDTNVGDERSSSTVDSGGERRLQESAN